MSDDFLSDEDKALFRQMAGTVKPLGKTKKIAEVSPKPLPLQIKTKPQFRPSQQEELYLSDYYQTEVQANSILSYCSHSIPHKRLRELKNGQIPWESKLDLHGLKPETAKQALQRFILEEMQLAHRCLLIVHGKGSRQGEPPVLKNLVNHWLPQFPQILAFHTALNRDGGAGALYLLLKRQREEG